MNDLDTILLALLFVGVVFFFKFLQSEGIKDRIKAEVKAHGGSDVHISWAIGDGDRDTFTYDVSFVDQHNRHYKTRCKIHSSGSNNTLYWTQSPQELIQANQPPTPQPNPQPVSSKEQIITELTAENERLQAEINRLAQESNK